MATRHIRLILAALAGALAAQASAPGSLSAQATPARSGSAASAGSIASDGAILLTLGAVLDSVRANSPVLDAARARVRSARGARTAAGALDNPLLSYQVENAPLPGGRSPVGMMTEHMTMASLPLAPFYQRGARVAGTDAAVRAADADARAVSQRVALAAARAYYRAALADVAVEAADNLTRWLDSVVAYNRSRVQQGAAAEGDLIRTELERDRALADAGVQAAELALARADLSAYLGDPASIRSSWRVARYDLPMTLATRASTMPNAVVAATSRSSSGVAAAPDAELDRRPDVIAARERLTAATAATSLEGRMRIRELGAMFGIKGSGGINTLLAGVSVPLPVFDQNRGAIATARAQRDAAGFELLAQERTARADMYGAAEAARVLTERANVLARRDSTGRVAAYLSRADEARAIALGAYREGAVPLLQVLDAARAWGDARLAYFRALYAQHEAVLSLVVSRGDDIADMLPTLTTMSAGDRTPR